MADIIRALTEAIDKIGLLAVLIVAVVVGAAYIVHWNKQLAKELSEARRVVAEVQGKALVANTVSMNENTHVLKMDMEQRKEEREALKKFGSDSLRQICKLNNQPAGS